MKYRKKICLIVVLAVSSSLMAGSIVEDYTVNESVVYNNNESSASNLNDEYPTMDVLHTVFTKN
jgi:hypothetical protein